MVTDYSMHKEDNSMKNKQLKRVFAFVIVSSVIVICVGAQEKTEKVYEKYFKFDKSSEFTSLQAKHIRPLAEGDMFFHTYDGGWLYISTDFGKKPYCAIKTSEERYWFPFDYRSRVLVVLAAHNEKKAPFYTLPIYLLDGEKGEIRHIIDARGGGAWADEQVQYLLYIDNSDGNRKPKIGLLDINSGKQIRQYDWKLDDTAYLYENNMSDVTFYRSRNTNYDFHIIYDIGSFTVAEGYLKVGDTAITTVFDKTSVGADYYLRNSK